MGGLRALPKFFIFNIGGQSGFKWRKHSQNKTWIENGNIIKESKGKRIK